MGVTDAPGILLARIADAAFRGEAPGHETGLLAGRNVLFALRGNETPDAARDWLDWHRRFHGASGALILDRGRAEGCGALSDAVADLAAEMEIVLVAGEEGSVDDAAPVDFALFELLRHRFLSEARAVAHLSIADLVLEDREGSPFDRAAALQGQALALTGTEVYPWKTEPGAAPAHADHGAVRLHEARQMSSWCVAPAGCPGDAVWRPTRIARMPVARVRPALFRRAMGVRHPDVPLKRLVEVRDLIADPDLEAIMAVAFGRVLARPSPSLARPAAPARERVAQGAGRSCPGRTGVDRRSDSELLLCSGTGNAESMPDRKPAHLGRAIDGARRHMGRRFARRPGYRCRLCH